MNTLAGVRKSKRLSALTHLACASVIVTVGVAACHSDHGAELSASGANAERGRQRIEAYGCGSCHRIPGIVDATGPVGPSLATLGRRTDVAGRLPQTRAKPVLGLMEPPAVGPGGRRRGRGGEGAAGISGQGEPCGARRGGGRRPQAGPLEVRGKAEQRTLRSSKTEERD